ncbi:uncharacterized protein [Amphiura filiformis]
MKSIITQSTNPCPKDHVLNASLQHEREVMRNWRNEELKKYKTSKEPSAEVNEKVMKMISLPAQERDELAGEMHRQLTLGRLYYWKIWVNLPNRSQEGFWRSFYFWRSSNNLTQGNMDEAMWERISTEEEALRVKLM